VELIVVLSLLAVVVTALLLYVYRAQKQSVKQSAREMPGTIFSATVTPESPTFNAADSIVLLATITNVERHPAQFSWERMSSFRIYDLVAEALDKPLESHNPETKSEFWTSSYHPAMVESYSATDQSKVESMGDYNTILLAPGETIQFRLVTRNLPADRNGRFSGAFIVEPGPFNNQQNRLADGQIVSQKRIVSSRFQVFLAD
jgi:hypothetical protein